VSIPAVSTMFAGSWADRFPPAWGPSLLRKMPHLGEIDLFTPRAHIEQIHPINVRAVTPSAAAIALIVLRGGSYLPASILLTYSRLSPRAWRGSPG
jgi:hypothetical protein